MDVVVNVHHDVFLLLHLELLDRDLDGLEGLPVLHEVVQAQLNGVVAVLLDLEHQPIGSGSTEEAISNVGVYLLSLVYQYDSVGFSIDVNEIVLSSLNEWSVSLEVGDAVFKVLLGLAVGIQNPEVQIFLVIQSFDVYNPLQPAVDIHNIVPGFDVD